MQEIIAPLEDLIGQYVAVDMINEETGEILLEAGDEINTEKIEMLLSAGIKEVNVLAIDHINVGAYLRNTLAVDRNLSREEALIDIYRVMLLVSHRPLKVPKRYLMDCSLILIVMIFRQLDVSK